MPAQSQKAESSYLDKVEEQGVVELARRYGPGVLDFLRDVLENHFLRLGFTKPVPLRERMAAADLLRKFASLPANIALDLGMTQRIIYLGDPREEDVIIDATFKEGSATPLLGEAVEAQLDPVDSSQGTREGNAVRRNSRGKSKREERLANK